MATFNLNVNGVAYTVESEPAMPLLWVLRDLLNLTGTKFGCGIGVCAACTVLVDGEPVRSCIAPISEITNQPVTTIEGLSPDGTHVLQQAWISESVSQCGYCQPAMIMTAAALLNQTPRPSDAEIDETLSPNLCRCGTYKRIRRAVHRAAEGGG
jgi:aerobic-type carbon monoxide dehydrogenase small subunit (CoxS/CutS family)